MAHSLGTRTYSANPPFVFTPRSKPVTITLVPKGKLEFSDFSTVPATSIPGG